jgi:hypothetical protein
MSYICIINKKVMEEIGIYLACAFISVVIGIYWGRKRD